MGVFLQNWLKTGAKLIFLFETRKFFALVYARIIRIYSHFLKIENFHINIKHKNPLRIF